MIAIAISIGLVVFVFAIWMRERHHVPDHYELGDDDLPKACLPAEEHHRLCEKVRFAGSRPDAYLICDCLGRKELPKCVFHPDRPVRDFGTLYCSACCVEDPYE